MSCKPKAQSRAMPGGTAPEMGKYEAIVWLRPQVVGSTGTLNKSRFVLESGTEQEIFEHVRLLERMGLEGWFKF